MDYDVLVLGGGIAGCCMAYELSKYNLNIAVIEKDYDVVDDISFVNASIIYDGAEAKDDTAAFLEKEGRQLIEEACKKFNVEYNKVGSIRVASDEKEIDKLIKMKDAADKRELQEVYLLESDKIKDKDDIVNDMDIKKALFCKNVSVINPYELAIAYGEIAADNGVNFKFQEEVIKIEEMSKSFKVITNKNKFNCRVVIDTLSQKISPMNDDIVTKNKDQEYMTYLMINSKEKSRFNGVVITKIDNEALVFNIPSLREELIIGIKSYKKLNQEEALRYSRKIIKNISINDVINMFTEEYENSMIIDYKAIDKGYIRLTGSNYSKMTLTPAISKIITEVLVKNLKVKAKKEFIDKRREFYRFSKMSNEERNEIINIDNRYGNIVCVCSQVSEGEIIDCIRRPLGARTVEGVRKRTGAGLGCCYGSYCSRKIIKILAEEMNINPTEVVQDEKNSKLWTNRIKEFDQV